MGYLLALLSTSPGDTSSAIESSGPRERSWLGDMIHAWKVTRPKDDGIRRVKRIYPDSDTTECVGVTKTSDQMITTRFAGHILQYPCTASHDGRSTVHYNQENEAIYQNHSLYLRVLISPNRRSIWRRTSIDYGSGRDVITVKLSSDGEKISHELIKNWISNATEISEFEPINTVVFIKDSYIRGFLIDAMNDREGYPNVGCLGSTVEQAVRLFDPGLPPFGRAQCSMSWNLNDYIRVRVQLSNSALVRDFESFYQKIDQGLRAIIVSEPRGTQTSM